MMIMMDQIDHEQMVGYKSKYISINDYVSYEKFLSNTLSRCNWNWFVNQLSGGQNRLLTSLDRSCWSNCTII